jgi:hypothetical protein
MLCHRRDSRVGFLVTNMVRPAENVVVFYNKRGTCEQSIKEGKSAIKWTRLSCRSFASNAVCLQLHALVKENGLENTQVMVTGVSPGGEYIVARGQTSPRGDFHGASVGCGMDN